MNDNQYIALQQSRRMRMHDSVYIVSMVLGATVAGILIGFAVGVFV